MLRKPSLRFAVSSLLAAAVFLALPIIAWGDVNSFFAHPARIGLVAISVIATIVALFSGASMGGGVREDRSNRWILLPVILISTLLSFLPAYMDRREIWTLDGDAVRYVGLALLTAGTVLRLWPVFVLGWRFSPVVAIQKDHALVTDGIYGIIRHPSYLGLFIATAGWALVFRSSVGLGLTVLLVPIFLRRIASEDALLASQFGSEYEAYRARTWRLIPYLY